MVTPPCWAGRHGDTALNGGLAGAGPVVNGGVWARIALRLYLHAWQHYGWAVWRDKVSPYRIVVLNYLFCAEMGSIGGGMAVRRNADAISQAQRTPDRRIDTVVRRAAADYEMVGSSPAEDAVQVRIKEGITS